MARIRTIKPEYWDDEKLAKVSRDARLTFIGMWTHSDDFGVVKGHVSWLKNNIFPYDDLSSDIFRVWLDELAGSGFIAPFDSKGEKFYLIKNFNKHQVIDRPSKSRNPSPPPSCSSNPQRTLDEHQTSDQRALDEASLMEGKGKGREYNKKSSADTPKNDPDPPTKKPPSAPLARTLSKDDIKTAAVPMVEKEIFDLCEQLHQKGIFVKAHSFANFMLKRQKNPRAILHALTRCYLKVQSAPFEDNSKNPWAYCARVMSVENGNFNEHDHHKDSPAPSR
jgi:hypothetical protein